MMLLPFMAEFFNPHQKLYQGTKWSIFTIYIPLYCKFSCLAELPIWFGKILLDKIHDCVLFEHFNKIFYYWKINRYFFSPSDEFCNFYDSAGSVLDSQHYIHPCSSQLSRFPQWKTSLVLAVEPAQLYAPLLVAGTTQFAHVETSIPPTTYTTFSMLLPSSNS